MVIDRAERAAQAYERQNEGLSEALYEWEYLRLRRAGADVQQQGCRGRSSQKVVLLVLLLHGWGHRFASGRAVQQIDDYSMYGMASIQSIRVQQRNREAGRKVETLATSRECQRG